jgi:acetylornithine/succinyldiaminopimelate/putrescine aminotransferase
MLSRLMTGVVTVGVDAEGETVGDVAMGVGTAGLDSEGETVISAVVATHNKVHHHSGVSTFRERFLLINVLICTGDSRASRQMTSASKIMHGLRMVARHADADGRARKELKPKALVAGANVVHGRSTKVCGVGPASCGPVEWTRDGGQVDEIRLDCPSQFEASFTVRIKPVKQEIHRLC